MNLNQLRDMVVMAGGDPSYDLEFEIPGGGDWSNMTVYDWGIVRIDHLRAVTVVTVR